LVFRRWLWPRLSMEKETPDSILRSDRLAPGLGPDPLLAFFSPNTAAAQYFFHNAFFFVMRFFSKPTPGGPEALQFFFCFFFFFSPLQHYSTFSSPFFPLPIKDEVLLRGGLPFHQILLPFPAQQNTGGSVVFFAHGNRSLRFFFGGKSVHI